MSPTPHPATGSRTAAEPGFAPRPRSLAARGGWRQGHRGLEGPAHCTGAEGPPTPRGPGRWAPELPPGRRGLCSSLRRPLIPGPLVAISVPERSLVVIPVGPAGPPWGAHTPAGPHRASRALLGAQLGSGRRHPETSPVIGLSGGPPGLAFSREAWPWAVCRAGLCHQRQAQPARSPPASGGCWAQEQALSRRS